MAVVVGTNSYISEAEAATYIALMGLDALSAPEPLLIRATQSLDRLYGARYLGTKSVSTQALAWPRAVADSTDADSNLRDFTTLPVELGQAVVELALLIDAGANVFAQPEPTVTKETVEIDVVKHSREFSTAYAPSVLHRISLILRPLLVSSTGVRLVRG